MDQSNAARPREDYAVRPVSEAQANQYIQHPNVGRREPAPGDGSVHLHRYDDVNSAQDNANVAPFLGVSQLSIYTPTSSHVDNGQISRGYLPPQQNMQFAPILPSMPQGSTARQQGSFGQMQSYGYPQGQFSHLGHLQSDEYRQYVASLRNTNSVPPQYRTGPLQFAQTPPELQRKLKLLHQQDIQQQHPQRQSVQQQNYQQHGLQQQGFQRQGLQQQAGQPMFNRPPAQKYVPRQSGPDPSPSQSRLYTHDYRSGQNIPPQARPSQPTQGIHWASPSTSTQPFTQPHLNTTFQPPPQRVQNDRQVPSSSPILTERPTPIKADVHGAGSPSKGLSLPKMGLFALPSLPNASNIVRSQHKVAPQTQDWAPPAINPKAPAAQAWAMPSAKPNLSPLFSPAPQSQTVSRRQYFIEPAVSQGPPTPSTISPVQKHHTTGLLKRPNIFNDLFPVQDKAHLQSPREHSWIEQPAPDSTMIEKQEMYKKKANAARQKREERKKLATTAESPTKATRKRQKNPAGDGRSPNVPPAKRNKAGPVNERSQPDQSLVEINRPTDSILFPGTPMRNTSESPGMLPGLDMAGDAMDWSPMTVTSSQNASSPYSYVQLPPKAPEPPPYDDLIEQRITSHYEDYKWSVTLYKIKPKLPTPGANCTTTFAQCWLNDFLKDLDLTKTMPHVKYQTHCTNGFIQDGDHLSFIVLYNAVDPFENNCSDTSTTIGYYGRYGHESLSDIHWITISPSIRVDIDIAVGRGLFDQVKRWTCDMPSAIERRFHRAYWLAANQAPLKKILSCAPTNSVPAHDALDDKEIAELEDPDFTEDDLDSFWLPDSDNPLLETLQSHENAALLWADIENSVFDMKDLPGQDHEHVVTSSSDWGQCLPSATE